MKTYTAREMQREGSALLDAADREGAVEIRRRNGRVYTLQRKSAARRITALPDFRTRLEKIFPRPIPAKQAALVDRMIAGE